MNALIGKVQVLPVNEYTVWYSPAEFPTITTNAHLVDGDGDLLLINPGYGFKVISVEQVNRIVTDYRAESEEINAQEIQEYDQYWADR